MAVRLVDDFFDKIENGRQAPVIQFFQHLVNDHLAAFEHAADAHFGHAHHHAASVQAAQGFDKEEVQPGLGQFVNQVEQLFDRLLVGLAAPFELAYCVQCAGTEFIGNRGNNMALLFQHRVSCCCMLASETSVNTGVPGCRSEEHTSELQS